MLRARGASFTVTECSLVSHSTSLECLILPFTLPVPPYSSLSELKISLYLPAAGTPVVMSLGIPEKFATTTTISSGFLPFLAKER